MINFYKMDSTYLEIAAMCDADFRGKDEFIKGLSHIMTIGNLDQIYRRGFPCPSMMSRLIGEN